MTTFLGNMIASMRMPTESKLLPKEISLVEKTPESAVEYRRLAQKLGVDTSALEKAEGHDLLMQTLSELGVRLYNENAVYDYLDVKYHTKLWRNQVMKGWAWYAVSGRPASSYDRSDVVHGGVCDHHIYKKPIPMPILHTMDSIVEKLKSKGEVKFYVTDEYKAPPIPDPFLAISFRSHFLIIERWDEPGFKG